MKRLDDWRAVGYDNKQGDASFVANLPELNFEDCAEDFAATVLGCYGKQREGDVGNIYW